MGILILRSSVVADEAADPIAALDFAANGTANSDVRLVWSGADLLPRNSHTAIWRARYKAQAGYYALTWHAYKNGAFHFDDFEYGAHPYPCDGAFSGVSGVASAGSGGSGTVHYMEMAGLGGNDYIGLPMDPAFLINDPGDVSAPAQASVWLTQARTAEVVGANVRHRVWPDLVNFPNDYIEETRTVAAIGTPATPAFYIGGSDWTASGDANSECPCCLLRGIRLFNAALSDADMQLEAAAAATGTNATASVGGAAAVWYINDNPTPSDVTAKAGSHAPAWDNANRPAAWSG